MPNLFKSNPLAAGLKSGEHVVHIIDEADLTGYSIIRRGDNAVQAEEPAIHQMKPGQAEVYSSRPDQETAKFFIETATTMNQLYDTYSQDREFCKVLESIRDYMVESHREKQQEQIGKMMDALRKYRKAHDTAIDEKTEFINNYFEKAAEKFNGGLKLTDEQQKEVDLMPVKEPASAGIIGTMSAWRSTKNRVLFPHEPSPTDIKQGAGLEDCFMLSALTKLAAVNPDYIKNSMKDNGDGTVTVRFYEDHERGENEPEPDPNAPERRDAVFIRVKKSESRFLVAGANSYASASEWVQIMEKAYAMYMNRQMDKKGEDPKGLKGINRGNSYTFMNAFMPEAVYRTESNETRKLDTFVNEKTFFTVTDRGVSKEPISPDIDSAKKKYLEKMFDFFKNHNDAVITLGVDTFGDSPKLKNQIKGLGIRTGHAYTFMKAYEKNGEKYIQVRDPYAVFNPVYNENGEITGSNSKKSVAAKSLKAGGDNMGVFDLKLNDFAAIFNTFAAVPEAIFKEYSKNVYSILDNAALKVVQENEAKRAAQQQAPAAPEKAPEQASEKAAPDDWTDLSADDSSEEVQPVENDPKKASEKAALDDWTDLSADDSSEKVQPVENDPKKASEKAVLDDWTDLSADDSSEKKNSFDFDTNGVMNVLAARYNKTILRFHHNGSPEFSRMDDAYTQFKNTVQNYAENDTPENLKALLASLQNVSEKAGIYLGRKNNEIASGEINSMDAGDGTGRRVAKKQITRERMEFAEALKTEAASLTEHLSEKLQAERTVAKRGGQKMNFFELNDSCTEEETTSPDSEDERKSFVGSVEAESEGRRLLMSALALDDEMDTVHTEKKSAFICFDRKSGNMKNRNFNK